MKNIVRKGKHAVLRDPVLFALAVRSMRSIQAAPGGNQVLDFIFRTGDERVEFNPSFTPVPVSQQDLSEAKTKYRR